MGQDDLNWIDGFLFYDVLIVWTMEVLEFWSRSIWFSHAIRAVMFTPRQLNIFVILFLEWTKEEEEDISNEIMQSVWIPTRKFLILNK